MNRAELKFEPIVREQFKYLENGFGFHLAKVSQVRVRFESADAFIEVYHGPKDYEVGIEFGRIGHESGLAFDCFCNVFSPLRTPSWGSVLPTPRIQCNWLLRVCR